MSNLLNIPKDPAGVIRPERAACELAWGLIIAKAKDATMPELLASFARWYEHATVRTPVTTLLNEAGQNGTA